MKIAYIHQYFKTPEQGGGIRSFHLANALVEAGHEVTMITAHNNQHEMRDISGIRVVYLPVAYHNGMSSWQRVRAFIKYVRLAKKQLRLLHKSAPFDLAYVMTTPLTTGLIARYGKKKLGIPYYFEVGDLWPEAPIQMGVIRNPILKKALRIFEKKCYEGSEKVIALSPDIASAIQKSRPNQPVNIIPNLADTKFFSPEERTQPVSKKYPLRVGYFGTFGAANNLESVLELAQSMSDLPISFTLMGHGMFFEKIQNAAEPLHNVEVISGGGMEDVKKAMRNVDAVLVSFKNLPVLATGSPNKYFDGLAAGKLIITNFGGWIGLQIEREACGFRYDPQNPDTFRAAILPFLQDLNLLTEFQKNARLVAQQYSVEKLSRDFVLLFDD